eukprot:6393143-Amphidinium_carterae.1
MCIRDRLWKARSDMSAKFDQLPPGSAHPAHIACTLLLAVLLLGVHVNAWQRRQERDGDTEMETKKETETGTETERGRDKDRGRQKETEAERDWLK